MKGFLRGIPITEVVETLLQYDDYLSEFPDKRSSFENDRLNSDF